MNQQIKQGEGWRVGWNPHAEVYQGLIGDDQWAIELNTTEFQEFKRLLSQLVDSIIAIQGELMEEEKIAIEVESDLMWLEAEGYPHAYSLRLILHQGRRCEGYWSAKAVKYLIEAVQTSEVW